MPTEPVTQPPADGALTLVTLGGFALVDASGTPRLGPGKPLALLACLATSPGRSASREQLINLLWADADPERARHALRQALWQLRQALGEDCIEGKEEIRLACEVGVDRNRFLAAIEAGDLDAALEAYQGPFIAAFASPGGAAFEHWADAERTQLQNAFLRAAELRARRLLAGGAPREAIHLARRMVEADPDGQLGRRLLIEAHLGAGDAISAANEAEGLLRFSREAEIELDPASRGIVARAVGSTGKVEVTGEGIDRPVARFTADLVGREREFSAILDAWNEARTGHPRHIHIMAGAGLGKTRLLLDLEARLRSTGARPRYLRAHPGDREIPGALASELAGALASLPGAKAVAPEVAATLVALDPALANSYGVARDPSSGAEALRRRILALTELMRATGEEGPYALLVDDLHWSDAESLAILEALLARFERVPVLLVTATRPVQGAQLRSEHRQAITLEPLSRDQVLELMESLGQFSDLGDGQRFAGELHDATSGNPLLVLELLSLASERGALRLAQGVWVASPDRGETRVFVAHDGIRQRIERLGATSRTLLTLLAVAGAPLEPDTLRTAARIDALTADQQLAILDRLGFITRTSAGIEPAHDEIAAVALQGDPAELETLRRQLAAALESTGEGSTADLARAGRQYLALDDHLALARLVRRARRLPGGGRQSAREAMRSVLGTGHNTDVAVRVWKGLPWHERTAHRRLLIAAGVAIFLAGSVAWRHFSLAAAEREREANSAVFEFFWQTDSTPAWRSARLALDPTTWDPLHPPTFGAAKVREEKYVNWTMGVDYSPDQSMLLSTSSPDRGFTGGQDVVLVRDGVVQVLGKYPRDDVGPKWNPDGRGFLFVTTRWSDPTLDSYSIGYYDLATGRVTPRVLSEAKEDVPIPGPDGSRFAYSSLRDEDVTPRLCTADADGKHSHCLAGISDGSVTPIGWIDDSTLAAIVFRGSGQFLEAVNVDDGSHRLLANAAGNIAAIDPLGEFLICVCAHPDTRQPAILVVPLRQIGRAGWLPAPSDFLVTRVAAVHGRSSRSFVDSLLIEVEDSLPTGQTLTLRAGGRDAQGRPIALQPTRLRWSIMAGSANFVDSIRGVVRAPQAGDVELAVSYAGWRSATKRVHFVAPAARMLVEERWIEDSLDPMWQRFGEPAPYAADHPTLGRGLFINGDESYASGVHSDSVWLGGHGLTVEVATSTPKQLTKHQSLVIGWGSAADSSVLRGWDHLTGEPPGNPLAQLGACAIGFPGGEGSAVKDRYTLMAGAEYDPHDADPAQRGGAVMTWRITVFPDGSCGTAVNGVPLFVSEPVLSMRYPFRLWIHGYSYKTRIAVGRVRVWQGDPGGVDWEGFRREHP